MTSEERILNRILTGDVKFRDLRRGRMKTVGTESVTGTPSFAAIDFEIANAAKSSACSVAVAIVRDAQIATIKTSLIRPPTRSFRFTHIHGLSWENVQYAASFDTVWREISPELSDIEFLCAHNASFDRSVLYACCDRFSLARPTNKFLCTVQLARSEWGIYPTDLPNVCERLQIPLTHHDAGSDAAACAKIVLKTIEHKRKNTHRYSYGSQRQLHSRMRSSGVDEGQSQVARGLDSPESDQGTDSADGFDSASTGLNRASPTSCVRFLPLGD